MKTSIYKLHVSVIALLVMLFMTKPSMSEATEPEHVTPGAAEAQEGVEEKLPATKARLKLQNAYRLYEKGDIPAAREDLEKANRWLQKAVEENSSAKEQTRQLANDIQALSEQLTSDSEQQQNAIVRLWHRSTALVAREMEDIIHRYNTLSTTEKTLKPLLDAKMHLFYAEHDLFGNHNLELAEYELDNVLEYLDDAAEQAKPEIKERINKIKLSIQALKSGAPLSDEAWHKESVNQALSDAQSSLEKARQYVSPSDGVRIDKVKSDLAALQKDIVKNSAKQYYDSAMYQLVQLINDLETITTRGAGSFRVDLAFFAPRNQGAAGLDSITRHVRACYLMRWNRGDHVVALRKIITAAAPVGVNLGRQYAASTFTGSRICALAV